MGYVILLDGIGLSSVSVPMRFAYERIRESGGKVDAFPVNSGMARHTAVNGRRRQSWVDIGVSPSYTLLNLPEMSQTIEAF
jgi:hypothetical protein